MKRTGFVYNKICNINNIVVAIMKASLGKRKQNRVKKILDNIKFYAEKIRKMLVNKQYKPSPYIVKIIQDASSGKVRTIYRQPPRGRPPL